MDEYDYIIIGGGSAGCVLANRLSARRDINVCLLEAGPPDTSPFIRMPLGIIVVLRSKILNWNFFTEKQTHCANRPIYWPRGRTLGGSSSINAMIYIRGNPHDYDEWAKLGNPGWSYQDVLPYFKKMQINVAEHRYINPLMKVFLEAGKQAGHTINDDFNGPTQEGVGYFQVSQKDGQRFSNASGYLREAEKRKNLTIMTRAHVTQIIFENKRAIGVRCHHDGKSIELFARKEIILSAGAISSPHLLLLSGVGPRQEIEKHGITLVHELPGVGKNLQDHLDIHISCLEKTHYAISFNIRSLMRNIIDLFRYMLWHKGEATSNYTQAGGFLKSDPDLPRPNLQWHFGAAPFTNSARYLGSLFRYYGYTLMTCALHPKSRGQIRLRNKDPFTPPVIDANYLADVTDLDTLVIGFKKSRELLRQQAFAPHFLREFEPGDDVKTDEQIRDYIRNRSETIYHPVGTCKMGRDPLAVVDPNQLKVYGLEGLRVIDASIMPTIITGNTNAATTMIAEKGADIILKNT